MFSVADRQEMWAKTTSFKRAAAAETHAESDKCWGGVGPRAHCRRGCETAALERFGGFPRKLHMGFLRMTQNFLGILQRDWEQGLEQELAHHVRAHGVFTAAKRRKQPDARLQRNR